MRQDSFPFNLGDIVCFKGTINETGLTEIRVTKGDETTIYKSGQTKMIPPVMVVVEVIKESKSRSHLYDESTGKLISSLFKVKCIWFSQNTGKFEERWFSEKMISILHKKGTDEREEFKINSNVALRTKFYSDEKISEIFKPQLQKSLEEPLIKYTITRTFNNLTFIPPIMLITDYGNKDNSKKLPIYNKTTGEKKRLISETYFKCMWYDFKSGKFSEDFFSQEALVLVEEHNLNDTIIKYIEH